MSDILAAFGILLLLGVAYPGLLLMTWLSFSSLTERAREQVAHHPLRAFWTGLGFSLVLVLPASVLLSLPSGVTKGLGWILILAAVSFSCLGAAGLALELGGRMLKSETDGATAGKPISHTRNLVLGALVVELASIFPLLGWLIVIPLATFTCFGAALFAVVSRKRAAPALSPSLETNPLEQKAPTHDALAS